MPTVKKVTAKVPSPNAKKTVKEVVQKKASGLTASVFTATGKTAGTISLPKEVFGAKINNSLMAQAVRVYLANQRQGTVSTKTRGEVEGSSKKIYRQKGTGRARHGTLRAPIFVKGGIVFGPKPRDYSMSFPKKMKKAALFSALTSKLKEGSIKIISGLEVIEPKTKNIATLVKALSDGKNYKTLLVVAGKKDEVEKVVRAGRNLENLEIANVSLLNTYQVLKYRNIYIMKDSIEVFSKEAVGEKTK